MGREQKYEEFDVNINWSDLQGVHSWAFGDRGNLLLLHPIFIFSYSATRDNRPPYFIFLTP